MALNKEILKKLAAKTENDDGMQKFILTILEEEKVGKGRYKEFYIDEIKKAIKRGEQ